MQEFSTYLQLLTGTHFLAYTVRDHSKVHYGILIVGAGPGGLAMAGRLRQAGLDFHLLEKSDRVAHRWHGHYDRLHLHTVKRLSHLPGLPFPDAYPVYLSRNQLVKYFDNYARHFDIQPEFGVEVSHISRSGSHAWLVDTSQGAITADHVVVATGVNNYPNIPVWPGQEAFQGRILHAQDYRNPGPFEHKRVLVVGMGNTGAEIALDLAEHGVATWISVRRPVSIVPRDLFGRPVQESARLLDKLPFNAGAWIGAIIQKLYFGNIRRYGLRRPALPPALQLRQSAKTPVVDIGTVRAIKEGRIVVCQEIRHLTSTGIVLDSGGPLEIDDIILATGYRHHLENLVDGIDSFLDPLGYPRTAIGDGKFDGLYFVGFNNYALGGILGTIFSETQTVVEHLRTLAVSDAGR